MSEEENDLVQDGNVAAWKDQTGPYLLFIRWSWNNTVFPHRSGRVFTVEVESVRSDEPWFNLMLT